jgi:hypothetical protein
MGALEILGLDRLLRRTRAWPREMHDAAVKVVQTDVARLDHDMPARAARYGGAARIAGASVASSKGGDGASLRAGGSGLAGELVMGAEFGGRRKPKRPYVTRSPKGTPYIVRRRTTMQFKPHLGHRGYWWFPVIREDLKGIRKRIRTAVVKAME